VLGEHQRQEEKLAEELGCKLSGHGYAFTLDPGGAAPGTADHDAKAFRRLWKQVGLDTTRPNDPRHFAATSLLSTGVLARTVSGRLGTPTVPPRLASTRDSYGRAIGLRTA
jgi:integrase